MALEPITRQEQIIAGKDLEPITRMEKFLKKYGGSGGSGGGVSPEEVTTIVKEQFPGGVGYSEENAVLFPEQEIFVTSQGAMQAECNFKFVSGETYTVTWNGSEYVCVGVAAGTVAGVGNIGAMNGGTDTGEPFIIMTSQGVLMAVPLKGDTSATVKITGRGYHTVDAKYLPFAETLPKKQINIQVGVTTRNELRAAIEEANNKNTTLLILANGGGKLLRLFACDGIYDPPLDGKSYYAFSQPILMTEDGMLVNNPLLRLHIEFDVNGVVSSYSPIYVREYRIASDDGSHIFRITVDNNGTLTATAI